MALPPTITTATLSFGPYFDLSGAPRAGLRATITPSATVRAIDGGAVVIREPVVVLTDADGTAAVTLPYTDDPDLTPQGFTYTVAWDDDHGYAPSPGSRVVAVPTEAGPTLSYDALLASTEAPGVQVPVRAIPGPRGEQGEEGPRGDAGPRGERGETGATGERGPEGARGPQGDRGDTGLRGETGATGDEGPAGPRGAQGERGATGPIGPAGLTWRGTWSPGTAYAIDDAVYYDGSSWFAIDPSTGVVPSTSTATDWQPLAARGATGPAGTDGEDGAPGAKGDPGPRGEQGQRGEAGATGDRGLQGERGEQGLKGDTGTAGSKGDKGDTGERGATGPAGPANLVVSPTNPALAIPGLWVQTGLDPDGQGITFWIEDGQP